jgi:hypothetical protein
MTESEFVASILQIVANQKEYERYEETKTSGPPRDVVMIRADAYDDVVRVAERYKRQQGSE